MPFPRRFWCFVRGKDQQRPKLDTVAYFQHFTCQVLFAKHDESSGGRPQFDSQIWRSVNVTPTSFPGSIFFLLSGNEVVVTNQQIVVINPTKLCSLVKHAAWMLNMFAFYRKRSLGKYFMQIWANFRSKKCLKWPLRHQLFLLLREPRLTKKQIMLRSHSFLRKKLPCLGKKPRTLK